MMNIQLEEKKVGGDKIFVEKEASRKRISSLTEESINIIQLVIDDMKKKRKTKGIEPLWLVAENIAKIDEIVRENL